MSESIQTESTQSNALGGPPLEVYRLPGLTDYGEAWALQQQLHKEISSGDRVDTLLLLEHPPTITMGRRGGWKNLNATPEALAKRGVQRWLIDRGGDITYHGPGQLVGYVILNLRRADILLGDLMRGIEQTQIDFLQFMGVDAQRLPKCPGVWLGNNKITAIGVRITSSTSLHGFAINLNTDLDGFERILPCGLAGKGVTSLARVLDGPVNLEESAQKIGRCFASVFNYTFTPKDLEHLPLFDSQKVEAIRRECLIPPPNSGTDSPPRGS